MSAFPPSKIRPPGQPTRVVERGRLLRRLDAAGRRDDGRRPAISLISATAGAGKTTLLADWTGRLPAGCVAWVTVDRFDNDPFVLWSAILASLRTTAAGAEERFSALVSPPDGMQPGFLAAFTDAIDRVDGVIRLVLDDVHELTDPAATTTLRLLLRHPPAGLQVVLSSRSDLAVGLERLRLEGRLDEIRTADLLFTHDEASTLIATSVEGAGEVDVRRLLTHTEGWAAGLRMAALSLERTDDAPAAVARLTGRDRMVADYLSSEIVAHHPPDVQQFLLATSTCDAVTVELAATLSGRADAGAVLDRLERSNALTASVDHGGQRWYRYHALLRDHLRAELARRDVAATGLLRRAAARWFGANGLPLQGLEHAVGTDDVDLTTGLLAEHGLALLTDGRGAQLHELLARLDAAVRAHPTVALLTAAAALDAGDVDAADTALHDVGPAPEAPEDARARATRAVVLLHRARLGGDVRAALEATDDSTGHEVDLDVVLALQRGAAQIMLGMHEAADDELGRGFALAVARGRDYAALQCLSHRAGAAAGRSQLRRMRQLADDALAFAGSRGWIRAPQTAYAHVIAAWAAYQTLDRDAARTHATSAVDVLVGRSDPTLELAARSVEAATAFDSGDDPRAALRRFRDAWTRLGGDQLSPELVAYAAPVEQRMCTLLGEHSMAADVARRTERLLGTCGEQALLRANLHALAGRRDVARRALRGVLDGSLRCHVVTTLASALLLEAVWVAAAGQTARGVTMLRRALRLCEHNDALRPFAAGGDEVRALLARHAGRFGTLEPFARRVLRTTVPGGVDLPEHAPLTPKEMGLLAELPSLHTLQEIAAANHVSPNTVKSHLRGIYRKLGVTSRREAVAVARLRGLL